MPLRSCTDSPRVCSLMVTACSWADRVEEEDAADEEGTRSEVSSVASTILFLAVSDADPSTLSLQAWEAWVVWGAWEEVEAGTTRTAHQRSRNPSLPTSTARCPSRSRIFVSRTSR